MCLFALLPIGIFGAIGYTKITESFTRDIKESLATQVRLKDTPIENDIDETSNLGVTIARTDLFKQYFELVATGHTGATSSLLVVYKVK